jgi:hypothetical protein
MRRLFAAGDGQRSMNPATPNSIGTSIDNTQKRGRSNHTGDQHPFETKCGSSGDHTSLGTDFNDGIS